SVSPNPVAENSLVTLQGTFTDDDSVTHSVTVKWGDGLADTTPLAARIFTFSATHKYADNGSKQISVTVTNSFGGSVIGNITMTVNNINPVVTSFTGPTSLALNAIGTFKAAFTDAPGDTHTCVITFCAGHFLHPQI